MPSEHRERVVEELGLWAIKTLITLNSGAFIVILTFVGNTSADSAFRLSQAALKLSLTGFAVGLGFTALTVFVSYLVAQLLGTEEPPRWLSGFRAFMVINMIFPSLGILSFFVGVYFAIQGVTAA